MACACGNKNSTTPSKYTVTTPSGERKTFTSEVEAVAAAKRTGGTWRKG